MKAWYVFHARPRCEGRASAAFAVRGLTAYVPRSCAAPNRQGEPLFPSYLFVYGDLATAGMALAPYLPDLGELVAFGGEPAQVPPPVMTWLQTQGEEPGRRAVASNAQPAASNLPADWQRVLQGAGDRGAREASLLQALRQTNASAPPGETVPDGVAPEVRLPRRRRTRGRGRFIHYRS
ncbi:MAG: hypothetical protein NT169_27145 [Chloroflexi bacterium]|nr:hypothetical protein [Chloroflexota bacterium]